MPPEPAPAQDLRAEIMFFDEERRYLLEFLERDDSAYRRWLIRQVLRTWDAQLRFVDPRVFQGKTVLEIGCGNPRMLFYARRYGAARAVGCDVARGMVDRGLGRSRGYAYTESFPIDPEEIEIVIGDIRQLAAGMGRFDIVILFSVLHRLGTATVLEVLEKVLQPGGLVLISNPNDEHLLREVADRVGWAVGLMIERKGPQSRAGVRRAFQGAGYQEVIFRALNPTLEIYFMLTRIISLTWPALAFHLRFPMALWRPLEDLLEDAVLRMAPALGWRCFFCFRRTTASAKSTYSGTGMKK